MSVTTSNPGFFIPLEPGILTSPGIVQGLGDMTLFSDPESGLQLACTFPGIPEKRFDADSDQYFVSTDGGKAFHQLHVLENQIQHVAYRRQRGNELINYVIEGKSYLLGKGANHVARLTYGMTGSNVPAGSSLFRADGEDFYSIREWWPCGSYLGKPSAQYGDMDVGMRMLDKMSNTWHLHSGSAALLVNTPEGEGSLSLEIVKPADAAATLARGAFYMLPAVYKALCNLQIYHPSDNYDSNHGTQAVVLEERKEGAVANRFYYQRSHGSGYVEGGLGELKKTAAGAPAWMSTSIGEFQIGGERKRYYSPYSPGQGYNVVDRMPPPYSTLGNILTGRWVFFDEKP